MRSACLGGRRSRPGRPALCPTVQRACSPRRSPLGPLGPRFPERLQRSTQELEAATAVDFHARRKPGDVHERALASSEDDLTLCHVQAKTHLLRSKRESF